MEKETVEPKYIVWSTIEYSNEDADVYYDIEGTARSVRKFKTLEEAKQYQAYLVSAENYN